MTAVERSWGTEWVHRHAAVRSVDRAYDGTARWQAAAGNITVHETCSCGAERKVHVNGTHKDAGKWG